jgi:autotransporter-associated beta strand protein
VQSPVSRPGAVSPGFCLGLQIALFSALIFSLTIQAVFAGSATWKADPVDNYWNTAADWTPATVPNSPSDTATFVTSTRTTVTTFVDTEVNEIVFGAGASSFTISPGTFSFDELILTLSGVGITNNSGVTQNCVTNTSYGEIHFTNTASAGGDVVFTNNASASSPVGGTDFFGTATAGTATFINSNNTVAVFFGGMTNFFDNSSAADGTFVNNGPVKYPNAGGATVFNDNSTAANGSFTNQPGIGESGGGTTFIDTATAGNATLVNNGPSDGDTIPGATNFAGSSTAGNATITNKGSASPGFGGTTNFTQSATAGSATIISEGGTVVGHLGGQTQFIFGGDGGEANIVADGASVEGAFGASTYFSVGSTAGNSTLIVNGGPGADGGGVITFDYDSTGGTSRVELFGNGKISFAAHTTPLTVGSIEGNGVVDMAFQDLTVGSNNLSTTFRGRIYGLGQLIKIGKGKLTLAGRNLYRGGTILRAGQLIVNNRIGSGTGMGPVQVDGGTLAGRGIIRDPVTIGGETGNHAVLSPGEYAVRPDTLTIQSALMFSTDGTYNCDLNSNTVSADEAVADAVTINSAAVVDLADSGSTGLTPGTVFTLISNTAETAISGTFSNLPDGSTVSIGSNTFQADYEGGDGNDLTLTVIP